MQRVRNLSKPSAAAKAVAEGRPAPSCTVVSDSEVRKMYELVEGAGVRAATDEAAHRKELKAISDARVANWPNTIEAQRLRKERARRERFDAEEERRKIIDEQEAELRAAKREQAIRNADMLLFEQNDRVKTFSSKLFLATVLEEREKQLQFAVERAAAAKQQEALIAQQQAEELRRAEQEEATKLAAIQRRTFDLKKSQLDQLAEIRKTKIAARDEDRAEGQMIKERAAAAVEEEIRLEAERVLKQKARDRELVAINEAHKALKAERLRQEQEEEKKILEFASLKEEQTVERKKRVDERKSTKLAARQQLIDRQAQLLQEIQQATEEREMRAMRDFDRERREREEREEAARRRRQKEIDDFRADYRQRKAEREAAEAAQKQRMKEVWTVRAERLIDEELEERQERRDKAEQLQHIHLLQWQEKQLQEAHDKRKLFEEGIHMQNALKQEQEQYEKYVSSVMADYVAKGRNSDLVQLAVRRARRVNSAQ